MANAASHPPYNLEVARLDPTMQRRPQPLRDSLARR